MPVTALSDAELLEQARNGDEAAFTELYVRHQPAALRLATTYRRLGDPEDLVNAAFEKVLAAIRRGGGPTEAFRAYLFVTLRRLAADQAERPADEPLDTVPEPVAAEAAEPGMARADRDIMHEAFESLPERWQTVLWHTAVEGRPPRELASVLGVSANAAAALAYRARERLRVAYLQAHLLASPHPECEPHRSRLGAYVRGGLSRGDQRATQRHVDRCESCRALVAELTDVNRMLVRSLLPLFLVGGGAQGAALAAAAGTGVAGGAVGSSATAAGAEAGAATGGASAPGGQSGGRGVWRRVRDVAPSAGSAAAAVALIAGLTAAGMAVVRDDGSNDVAADAAGLGSNGSENGVGDVSDVSDDTLPDGPSDSLASPGLGLFGDDDSSDLFGDGDSSDLFGDGDSSDLFDNPPFASDSPADDSGGMAGPANLPPSFPPESPPPAGPPSPPPPASPPPPPPAAPPAPPPRSPTPPPSTTPPPGGPGPVQPPEPALSFTQPPEWEPTGVGRGTLTVQFGEAAGPVALAAAEAAGVPRDLRVELTDAAGPIVDGLDPRCQVLGPAGSEVVGCVVDPPPAGTTDEVQVPLSVSEPEQSATVTLRRGSVVEDTAAAIPLDRYEEGLGLIDSALTQFDLVSGVPAVRLTVGAEHLDTRPLPGVSMQIDLAGDAGFVPAVAGGGGSLLPEGCTIPPPGDGGVVEVPGGEPPVLRGGLPTRVLCDLGELTPGSQPTRQLVALVEPWYRDGDGVPEAPSATVTLMLQDPTPPAAVHRIDEHQVPLDLPEG
jgi:RNA polymerase sigma factor (sigma-70 family)